MNTDQLNSDLMDKGADLVGTISSTMKANPISTALIGMGVAWLLTGGHTVDRAARLARRARMDRLPDIARDTFNSAYEGVQSGYGAVGDQARAATDAVASTTSAATRQIARTTSDYAGRVSDAAHDFPGTSAEWLTDVRDRLSDMFEAQPLILGAVGVAIGAGLAAALPPTAIEADYFGETSDDLRSKASQYVSEQTTYATNVVQEMANSVVDEAQRQGLSLDGAKDVVAGVANKVSRVVDTVTQSASDHVR